MEQAGMTAAVPTQAKKQPVTDLGFQPDGSVDAVVALGVLGQLGSAAERQRCLRECARVLKPGMPLVMVEPLAEGGSPLRALIGVSAGQERLPTAELQALQQDPAFSFVQWDVVLQGQDPHAVGVAVRSERAVRSMAAADDGEDRGSSSKQRRRAKQPKTAQGFRQQQ
jgi:predicted methyltransferase